MEIKADDNTNIVNDTLGKILEEITNDNSSETETENLIIE